MKYKRELLKIISNIALEMERDVVSVKSLFLDREDKKEKIEEYCKTLFQKEFKESNFVKSIISKREEFLLNENGELNITFVEIDNYDLIDTNFSLGTIFGIYRGEIKASNLISAIYIAYGPSLEIIYGDSEKVEYYKLLKGVLTYEDRLLLKEKGKINSTGGNKRFWSQKHKSFIEEIFSEGYRLRYSNSLVMDTHQILFKKGGIYSSPNIEVSTLFEAFPISFIIEKAGGFAIDLEKNILEKEPNRDSTTPLYFGSKYEIEKLREFYKKD